MKKFTNLLKKEVRELLTAQLLVSLLFMMALFYFIGDITKKEVAKASGTQTVAVLDFDDSEASRGILKGMEAERFAVQSMAGKTKELKLADGVYAGDLTPDGIKEMVKIARQIAGHSLEVNGAKWSVKFWLKDGSLAKYEYNVQGTVSVNGNDRDVDLKNAVEIKDVGTTKVTVPEEAAKRLQTP